MTERIVFLILFSRIDLTCASVVRYQSLSHMKLVIVESPAKAKTIEKYLGKGFIVRASVGHIRDLPKSNKDAVDIEGGFKPRYQIVKEKQKVIDELHSEAEKADE